MIAPASPAQTTRESFRPQVIRLAVESLASGESLDDVLWEYGRYRPDTLDRLYRLMRDQRENRQTFVDVELFEILARIHMELGVPLLLMDGYRTARTAAGRAQRQREPDAGAVAMHVEGRAADIHVPGVAPERIAAIARGFRVGGVSIYPTFVHVDTGPTRSWVGR